MNTIPVLDCTKCGNPLLQSEIKAQQMHCAPCKKLLEAYAHQEQIIENINRANSRAMR